MRGGLFLFRGKGRTKQVKLNPHRAHRGSGESCRRRTFLRAVPHFPMNAAPPPHADTSDRYDHATRALVIGRPCRPRGPLFNRAFAPAVRAIRGITPAEVTPA